MCRVNVPAGVRATWHPARRVVTCLTCGVKAGAGGLDTPGASARREYDRRRAAREDRARQTLGLLGVVLAKTIDEPQSTRAWKTGADGEGRVGKRLAKLLAGTEVRLLHDRRIPGHGAANIDHLAVGPGGITVIDTKSYRGKVRTERIGGLFSERRTLIPARSGQCIGLTRTRCSRTPDFRSVNSRRRTQAVRAMVARPGSGSGAHET